MSFGKIKLLSWIIVSGDGVSADPKKIQAVVEWPVKSLCWKFRAF